LFTRARGENGLTQPATHIAKRPLQEDFSEHQRKRGGIMEHVGRYASHDSNLANKAAAIGNALLHIAQRVLAILAVLAFTYGLIAAEVELAKIEQITDPAPR
jgi:hypothetical protein